MRKCVRPVHAVFGVLLLSSTLHAQEMPAEYQQVLSILGKGKAAGR